MTENHSFGCIEDRIAMGLYDFNKAEVYQKPKEMTEELNRKAEEYWESWFNDDSKTIPDLMAEFATEATKELQEENKQLKLKIDALSNEVPWKDILEKNEQIKGLEKQIEKMKCCCNCDNIHLKIIQDVKGAKVLVNGS